MLESIKIKYTRDDDGYIRGAVATDPVTGWEQTLYAPAYGGLWVNGYQKIGHCDFKLAGQNANRRRVLRRIAYDAHDEFMEARGLYER